MERKRLAICIGCEYWLYADAGLADVLPGCHRDAKHMYALLKEKYHFDDVLLMIDDEKTAPEFQPTRNNILTQLEILAKKSENADIVITYAGHGSQLKDSTSVEVGDELDGLDETIVPLDYMGPVDPTDSSSSSSFYSEKTKGGQIRDDDFKKVLAPNLFPSSRVVGIFDSCHSGTILDLPFLYNLAQTKDKNVHLREQIGSQSLINYPCPVICLSGCRDDQTSLSVISSPANEKISGLLSTPTGSVAFDRSQKEKKEEKEKPTRITDYPQIYSQTALAQKHDAENAKNNNNKKKGAKFIESERAAPVWEGAMSWALLTSLETLGYNATWPQVFYNVRQALAQKGYTQLPMLSSSEKLSQNPQRASEMYFVTWESDPSVTAQPLARSIINSKIASLF